MLEYLSAQQARGISHLHLDPDARSGLRALSERLRTGKPGTGVPAVVATASVRPPPVRVLQLDELAPQEVTSPPPLPAPQLLIEGASRAEKLASLQRQADAWPPARALGSLREVLVFATGNPEARLMFIGDAPGYEEEKKRLPFVGPAGQQLDKILTAMGVARSDVYLSNIVKFRPATARQTTNNRPPSTAEIAACLPLLHQEIAIVRPQCIIALGGSAADGLLGRGGDVAALRGAWHEHAGVPLRVTYHPSQLLLAAHDTQVRRLVWEDLLAVMERCGMPISDKQRGFFPPKP
ncbi:MAG: uracil-DNA glycosylase [Verrucomicrobia bacterium]|nr:MAG: uracil-DNA glycosylase [Verrucomicrobiota bacterium]